MVVCGARAESEQVRSAQERETQLNNGIVAERDSWLDPVQESGSAVAL